MVSEAASSAAGTAEGRLSHEDGSGVDGASVMSPQSALSHFMRSADAFQAECAGSQQLQAQQSLSDEESCTALDPSLPQLDSDELEPPAGHGKEAASSCREALQEGVGESDGQAHSPMPREGRSSEGVAAPPYSHAVEPSQRQVSAQSAPGQRRPSSALEIARRLRRTPASKSGADSSVARSGDMSEAKLGSHAGRGKIPEAPSSSASVGAQADSPDVTTEKQVDGSAASSIGSSGRQGAGMVQSEEEDLTAQHVSQAVDNAHMSRHNEQKDRAAEPSAAAAEALPADAEEQHKALLLSEQKEHQAEQELPFKCGDGAQAAMEGTAEADAPKTSSDRTAAKALHTMSYLPLAGVSELIHPPYQ